MCNDSDNEFIMIKFKIECTQCDIIVRKINVDIILLDKQNSVHMQIQIIIIMEFIYRGYPYQCQALFSLRALFSATRIHSNRRMDSLIRTRLSDLRTGREVGTFGEKTFGYSCTQDQNLLTYATLVPEPPTYNILGRQH